ncbi:MAG: hypothetical protein ACRD1H_19250, partial [Vicinamibacterales bacterium]
MARCSLCLWPSRSPYRAQEIGELDLFLDRLGQYLIAYEAQLSTVVADERYEQSELRAVSRTNFHVARRRTLASDVAFLRLPGESTWFGVRDVRMVDGKPVVANDAQLQQLLKRLDAGALEEAARIVA